MTLSYLRYGLQAGFIHNWLVAGPVCAAAPTERVVSEDTWQPHAGIDARPCERAKFAAVSPNGAMEAIWRYQACDNDHLVDATPIDAVPDALCAWAYCELVAQADQPSTLMLHAFGRAELWINGQVVASLDSSDGGRLLGASAGMRLVKGANRCLVRLDQTSSGAPLGFALAVHNAAQGSLTVRLPTLNRSPSLHKTVERLATRAYLDQDLYAGPEGLYVNWPGSVRTRRRLLLRVEKPSGDIVGEAQPVVGTGSSQHLLEGKWAKDGRYQVKVLPEFEQFIRGLRVSRELDVNILHGTYTDEPQGEQPQRAVELLEHTAWWTDGIYAVLAAMALNLWKQVDERAILRMIDQAATRAPDGDEMAVALLFMVIRYHTHLSFPAAVAQRAEEWLLAYEYCTGRAVDGAVQGLDDDRRIVSIACSVLAGQLYLKRHFLRSGRTGDWHQAWGEREALAWFTRRAQGGFAAWDSGEGFAAMLLGLMALVDHATSAALADLAAATADKLLFTLAVNSLDGIFGSTHGTTSAASVTDGRMDPMSGVSRLLWGVGCWNQHVAAPFALATSQTYGCPPLHQLIARERPAARWTRERHVTAWRDTQDGVVAEREVNKVAYKTPDYLLCSAQDHYPGEPGGTEHIWQATMGPSAVVFVNHPRWLNQKDAYRANFWRGNGVLPRVAQWRDLVVAVHHLPDDDWLAYTHAHFPLAAFDAYKLRQGWAFARKGDAYLALTASAGLTLIKSGPGAFRELRSVGQQNVWLCQMGRAAEDGSFAEFQRAVLDLPVRLVESGVSMTSLRGEEIAFGWTGPLRVQGAAQPLHDFPHYDSPYCTTELGSVDMDIQVADWTLRLNLDTA